MCKRRLMSERFLRNTYVVQTRERLSRRVKGRTDDARRGISRPILDFRFKWGNTRHFYDSPRTAGTIKSRAGLLRRSSGGAEQRHGR